MAYEAIYKYVSDQNRPFSVNEVFESLQKKFGKAEVQRTVDKLVEEDKVIEKLYGKSKVYCLKQDDAGSKEEIRKDISQLDSKIFDLNEELKENVEKLKKSESELKELLSSLTTDEAKKQKVELEAEIKKLQEKYDKISGSENGKPVVITEAQRNKCISANEKIVKEYRKRKRICMDIIEAILEGYPKSKKHLIDEIGLETDEDVGFKLD